MIVVPVPHLWNYTQLFSLAWKMVTTHFSFIKTSPWYSIRHYLAAYLWDCEVVHSRWYIFRTHFAECLTHPPCVSHSFSVDGISLSSLWSSGWDPSHSSLLITRFIFHPRCLLFFLQFSVYLCFLKILFFLAMLAQQGLGDREAGGLCVKLGSGVADQAELDSKSLS